MNANIFQDTMAATGLVQWMDFPTHRLGNTLDLVFTKCSSSITITSCTQGPLWSDHFAVEMTLSRPKPLLTCQELQYCKIRSIDTNLFGRTIDTCSLLDINDFEEQVSKFSGNLQSTLDAMAALKTKAVTQHPPKSSLTMKSPSRNGLSEIGSMFLRNTEQNQPGWPSKQRDVSYTMLYIHPRRITFLI